jgi:hypothetical protein
LAPAPPDGVSFQWEKLASIARELLPLFREHYAELEEFQDVLPMDPAWEALFEYERLGLLYIFTIRSDGLLVGYSFVFMPPSLHYASTRVAYVERFFLKPEFRHGRLGIHLFKAAEVLARDAGAAMLYVPIRLQFAKDRGTIGKILERMDYGATETVYAKRLK